MREWKNVSKTTGMRTCFFGIVDNCCLNEMNELDEIYYVGVNHFGSGSDSGCLVVMMFANKKSVFVVEV